MRGADDVVGSGRLVASGLLGDGHAVSGASAGDSFLRKMVKSGIEAVLAAEPYPAKAVSDYMAERLSPPKSRLIGELVCKLRDALSSSN